MLKAEKNLRVTLEELNKLGEDRTTIEEVHKYKDEVVSLNNKVDYLKADLFWSWKSL